ncbi:MAG: RICIN domain-containing protein [Paludibacteraceae bacterium]
MSRKLFIISFLFLTRICYISGQTTSISNTFIAEPIPDRTVFFNLPDEGISKPIIWGLDLAWLSETNIHRGIAYMGPDKIDVVRSSFTPTDSLINGDLKTNELTTLNKRLDLIALLGSNTKVVLNCDHPSVSSWYIGKASRWAQLIDVTVRRHQEKGRTVVSVSPFNEPDYGWSQFSGSNGQYDFYNIAGELRNNTRFDNIRICGGNTLNCDQALPWYNYLKTKLNEGNTHQLAGSFDNYVNFYQTVRTNGHHATNDELHNVMEAMVGVEYGLQTGIWWGTAEYARSEFVKASYGKRLGYAEHRPNWTAASVYRHPEGKIQAFGGTSERQAVKTTYRFVSKDRDVFFDGRGPQREYTMVLPGGTGYQQGQTNAEKVVNITWGDDIQPVIKGKYALINRKSGKAMEVLLGYTTNGTNIIQRTYSGKTHQQWFVNPVDSTIGGDFSYFTLIAVHSGKVADVNNFSLSNGGNVQQWEFNKNSNQQWFLEYTGDGWFYIRNRESALCLEVANESTSDAANVQQWEKDGGLNQQWRLLPIDSPVEFTAPSAPGNLVATPNAESVRLDWNAAIDTDVAGYSIFRSETSGGPYNTIARDITSTSFVDNTTTQNGQYYYVVKAADKSLNRSGYSNEATAITTGSNSLVAHLKFENNPMDSTINLNHSAIFGGVSYVAGKVGVNAISLNGSSSFLQLPSTLANQREITIAAWIYWRGASGWQRIFDFGNDQTQYLFLTPNTGGGQMRFAIKNGGDEQQLNTKPLSIGKWAHVTVTLGETAARIYVDGVLAVESTSVTLRPLDFKPILNSIGRSQFSDPLFNGYIDDFRVYNYALSPEEVKQIAGLLSDVKEVTSNDEKILLLAPVPADNVLRVKYLPTENNYSTNIRISIFSMDGKLALSECIKHPSDIVLNVSQLPSATYMLQVIDGKNTFTRKIIIHH